MIKFLMIMVMMVDSGD